MTGADGIAKRGAVRQSLIHCELPDLTERNDAEARHARGDDARRDDAVPD
jgi:hypothetical protein